MLGKKNEEVLIDESLVGGVIALDRLAKLNKANRTFKRAFYLSMALNVAAVTSIVMMMPLKKTDIFVYGIDRYTGEFKIVKRSDARQIVNSEAVVDSATSKFVSLLFGYSKNSLRDRKDQLMQYCDVSFQTQAMRMFNENIRQFVDKVRAEAIISSNIQREKVKNSPLTRLTFFITIKITPDTMENYEYITKKQVTIYYDFARGNSSQENLIINPFGFKVFDIQITDLQNEQTVSEILRKIKEVESKNKALEK
ncbi:cag pathogenicity island type IV secretion system protein CagV [Helicobacter pylori]